MLKINIFLAFLFFLFADFIGLSGGDISDYGKRVMLLLIYLVLMGTSSHYLSGSVNGLLLIRADKKMREGILFALTCILFVKASIFIGFCYFKGLEKLVFAPDLFGLILLIPLAWTSTNFVLSGDTALASVVGIPNKLDSKILGDYRKVYYELVYCFIFVFGITSFFFTPEITG